MFDSIEKLDEAELYAKKEGKDKKSLEAFESPDFVVGTSAAAVLRVHSAAYIEYDAEVCTQTIFNNLETKRRINCTRTRSSDTMFGTSSKKTFNCHIRSIWSYSLVGLCQQKSSTNMQSQQFVY